MIKLLDCTLRDGGYYTNWNFDTQMVQDLVTHLDLAGVDIIELGYKSPMKGGKYRKCNDRFIWEVLEHKLPVNADLAFMIDAKDFVKGGVVDYSLIDDVIHDKTDSPFSICRLAIKYSEIEVAKTIGRYIKSKGYDLIINLMGITTLTDEQIQEFILMAELEPTALYFADSYGNLEPKQVQKITSIFNESGINVGIHTHDNLGLAFANCLAGLDAGATYIDGTLLGMGRGVGNVKTEQLITFLQHSRGYEYQSTPIQKFIYKWMKALHSRYNWGFTHNYMIAGIKHIHPLYVQTLQNSFLNSNRIEDILVNIEDSNSFDQSKIEEQMQPKVAVVIPARYKSSRFPGKPLAKIKGKEMVVRVAEIAEQAVGADNVYIATENEEIVDVVKKYGYKVILTSDSCLTGTDRVAEAALEIDADIIINIQGDEPMLDPNDIKKVIEAKLKNPTHVINCMAPLNAREDIENKKIPKVVSSINNELLYMSRNAIPGTKTGNGSNPMKQVCIYAFNRVELAKYSSIQGKTPLENQEDIEILRFLELGHKVKMVEVDGSTHAVDYPEDIKIVEGLL
jgi:3-deoxy-manno-octulosonate cytidylyltransferase (CMP-KDO synthetase)